MEQVLDDISKAVLTGDLATSEQKVQQALDAKIGPGDILTKGLVEAMAEVGRLFEEGEYFVPEMLIAARAMKGGLAILKPHLAAADVKPAGVVAAGTVKGDLHDIGKNLVCMMLEGAGFEVVDLGVDVPPDKFVDAVRGGGIDVVAMSALLTTTMPGMKSTIEAFEESGLRDTIKIMVGGAPVTDAYADEIRADGYAADASSAARLALSLLS